MIIWLIGLTTEISMQVESVICTIWGGGLASYQGQGGGDPTKFFYFNTYPGKSRISSSPSGSTHVFDLCFMAHISFQ